MATYEAAVAAKKDSSPPVQSKEEQLLVHLFRTAQEGDVDSLIHEIDRFASSQWMMNVGDVKGALLDAELQKKKPKHAVELGAYCGYSALRIAKQLPEGGHLTSIEINPLNAAIATKIVELAGLQSRVTIRVGTVATQLEYLRRLGPIDLLFIDHLKTAYKPDLLLLEEAGLIQPGGVVVADNCLVPGAPDYVAYVQDHPNYESVRHETLLEYSDQADHVWVSTRK